VSSFCSKLVRKFTAGNGMWLQLKTPWLGPSRLAADPTLRPIQQNAPAASSCASCPTGRLLPRAAKATARNLSAPAATARPSALTGPQLGNMNARVMDSVTFKSVVVGAVLVAILTFIYSAYRRRRRRAERLLTVVLLGEYFRGDMSADQLGKRTREIVDRHFMGSSEFYALVIAAFQGAVDAKLGHQARSKDDERKLLGLLAALKKEFGLTDRYQIEA
jgi:hypothetical protein